MRNRKKYAIVSMVFGLLNKILNLLVPFGILLLIKNIFGAEYLGLNSLFTSLLQMLTLAEMGFGSAMVYEMYRPAENKDFDRLSSLLSFYKKIYRILGIIILTIGICCIPFLKFIVKGTIPKDVNIIILFLIYLFNTYFSYSMFSYKKSILQAFQRNDIVNKISLIVNILLYFSQFLALIILKNYYIYILLLPVSTIIDNILTNSIVKKYYEELKSENSLDLKTKKDILLRVKALAGHKIGGVVICSLDSIVISAFLGLNDLALYTNYFFIIKALNGIINIGYNSILPGIGNSIIVESEKHNYFLFKKITLLLKWFVGVSAVCLIIVFQPIIKLWMGSSYLLPLLTMILFVVYYYVWQIRVVGLAFKDAAGMWKEDFWKPYIGLVINLVTNIILVNLIGINGVLISTIIVMVFIYFPWETKVLFDRLFKCKSKDYYLNMIYHLIITLLLSIILYYVFNYIVLTGIIEIIIKSISCFIIVNIVYILLYYKTEEFQSLKNDCLKILLKIRGDR